MSHFIVAAIAISIFFISYSWFLFCGQKNQKTDTALIRILRIPTVPFMLLGFIGCLAAWFMMPDRNDALFNPSLFLVVTVFASAAVLQVVFSRVSSLWGQYAAVFAFCLLNCFLLPTDFSLSDNLIPMVAERFLLALVWSILAFMYNILNDVDGVLTLQSLSVSLGMGLLFIFDVLPAVYGYYSAVFIALFLSFNFFSRYPAAVTLKPADCRILGYLIGWLGILGTVEGDGSCFVILSMYYIYELITAALKKLCLRKKNMRLVDYTFYSQAAASGVPPQNICELVSRANLFMLMLGGFQIYAPNNYTMIIFSFFIIFWVTSRTSMPTQDNRLLLTGTLLSLFRSKKDK